MAGKAEKYFREGSISVFVCLKALLLLNESDWTCSCRFTAFLSQ